MSNPKILFGAVNGARSSEHLKVVPRLYYYCCSWRVPSRPLSVHFSYILHSTTQHTFKVLTSNFCNLHQHFPSARRLHSIRILIIQYVVQLHTQAHSTCRTHIGIIIII